MARIVEFHSSDEPYISMSEALDQRLGEPLVYRDLDGVLADIPAVCCRRCGEGQYRFVPGRLYRFDRAWPAHLVAVEIQGGLWVNGAHSRGSGVERDCVKLSIAAALGWRVLPISKAMIESGQAVELIAQALGLRP